MAKKNQRNETPSNNAPVATRRIGSVRGSIWAREGNHGPIYSVSFDRSYIKSDKTWGHSHNFDRDDLLVLAKVSDWCHTWIVRRIEEDRQAQSGGGQ